MSQLEDLVAALDAETTAVSHKIDKLQADLAAALADGKAPEQATLDALAAISNRLKSIGSDPTNPIPTPTTVSEPVAPAPVAEAPAVSEPSTTVTAPAPSTSSTPST